MYLMIRNPGVADYRGFTLIGASTTRNGGREGTIGQFGSGSKLSVAYLLRHGIRPVICPANLKMDFFSKPELIQGQEFNRVCVKFSGKDLDESSVTRTEDLGFTLEWGEADWTGPGMAVREFVSNAIDGAIGSGGSFRDVEFDIVPKPRAKAGCTTVFIPYEPAIEAVYRSIGDMFLHFGAPHLLGRRLLPKRKPGEDRVLIYKKGVLVASLPGKSVYDYDLDELRLDESRNAHEWDVQYAVAHALRDASSEELANVLVALTTQKGLWEGRLSPSYLATPDYEQGLAQKRQAAFQTAWKAVAGEKGVATGTSSAVTGFVEAKGFVPKQVETNWLQVLEGYGVPTETKVLSKSERDGKEVSDPSQDMLDAVDWAWNTLGAFNLLNGRTKPPVKGFMRVMDGGTTTRGVYDEGVVYLHKELGGDMLKKVALEEVVHHVTGADDGSRDIQDYLFRLVVAMAG